MKAHEYALYLIDIGQEIERRKTNDARLDPSARAAAQNRFDHLTESRELLLRDRESRR